MSDKVISLADRKKEVKEEDKKKDNAEYDFEAIMKANKAKEEKIKKEKLQENKGVLRSYRIKH